MSRIFNRLFAIDPELSDLYCRSNHMIKPHDFKGAVAKIQQLNPSPAVYAKAHRLIIHPDSQLNDIVNVVKLDSALTADIIGLSNSAALGVWESTGNLNTALGRLGLKEVDRFLALSISKSTLNRDLTSYHLSGYQFWSTSVSVAILMELLASRNLQEQADAYTVGILHATGRLVIDQALRDLGISEIWDQQTPIGEWESSAVGCTSAEAGAYLLHAWGFPLNICEVIAGQAESSLAPQVPVLLKMLHFCLRILALSGPGFTIVDWELPDNDPLLLEFNIPQAEIHEIVEIASDMHAQAARSLGLKP